MRSPRALLLLGLVLVAAGCGGGGGSAVKGPPPSRYRGTVLSGPAPGFSLQDDAGKTVSLAGDRGHWVIVTFLYTHCPDVCPVIAGKLNAVLHTPLARHAGLRVIAVSVDPRRDTPAAVRQYAKERGLLPTFNYLIGSHAELAPVWRKYHIAVLPGPSGTVTHDSVEFLIDPQGKERLLYDKLDLGNLSADVEHDLGRLGVA
jgi:protein SCO1